MPEAANRGFSLTSTFLSAFLFLFSPLSKINRHVLGEHKEIIKNKQNKITNISILENRNLDSMERRLNRSTSGQLTHYLFVFYLHKKDSAHWTAL